MGEELVNVIRGGLIESVHSGHIAIVNSHGELLYEMGNPYKKVYARSSMKPIQAIPIVEQKVNETYLFEDADLSLCCASHIGEPMHTERVQNLLETALMGVSNLKCGAHPPRIEEEYKKLLQEGKPITAIYNNCSGKHTGMLLTAKVMGEDLENYYLLEHPVQQRILDTISEVCEYPREQIEIGIDGCGVPVHGLPLYNIALGYARMSNPQNLSQSKQHASQKIIQAMTSAPEMVGGTDTFCTSLMTVTKGKLFGKAGAEAVYCIGHIDTGIGIAIKIDDGNSRAVYPVAVEVLKQLNLISKEEIESLKSFHEAPLKNVRKQVVGTVIPKFMLHRTNDITSK
ncbi:asparaginase [Viridibacillus arvi]|uniref:asparaginase n=1 Tax=Viridibacillus arvi TaxID=263475 RepID=UPI00187B9578|nr:asparaginase [Viridibacillus sp. JNUCC-6]QOV11001.1 asparaginase [Viridibacillus sp. JNUCC-6]